MLKVTVCIAALSVIPSVCPADEQRPTLSVWPGAAPGEQGDVGKEETLPPRGPKPVQRITNVTEPMLTLFQPPEDKRTDTAVVVCPGGGYSILAYDLEGTEVAEWLNSIGVTAVLLKYRVPRRKDREKHAAPLQDAQRALSLVRSHAKEWGVNPKRIGILGFSAGGHLSATTSTNFDRRAYEPIDDVDQLSCRPDFTVLVYPAYLSEDGRQLPPEIRITKDTPPAFFAHAADDNHGPENSIAYFLALKKAGVLGELHVYSSGGHGFGLRPSDHPCSTWPARCEAWMRNIGVLETETQTGKN